MGKLSESFNNAVSSAGYEAPESEAPTKKKSLSDSFQGAVKLAEDKPAIEYIDDSNNPNAAPPSGMRVDISGVPKTAAEFGQRVVGSGEAALNMVTGMGAAIPGAVAAISSVLTNGKYGTKEGVEEAAQRFHDVSDAYTYHPRTEQGQQYSSELGQSFNDSGIVGLGPMAQFHSLAGASKPAMASESAGVSGQLSEMLRAKQSAPAIVDRLEPTFSKPRIKLNVDGTTTPVDQPSGVTADMMANPPGAANQTKYTPPTLQDTPPAFQKTAKGLVSDATLQRHIEAQSLPIPMKLTAGMATQDPNIISKEMNFRGENPAVMNRQNELNGQLVSNLSAIRDQSAPLVTAKNVTEHGDNLISSYSHLEDARSAEVKGGYQKIADKNSGNLPVDGKVFATNVNAELKSEGLVSTKEFLPAAVGKIVERIKTSDQQMTIDDYSNFRTILAAEARKAERAGDGNAVNAVNVVRNNLENMPMSEGAAALKPLIDNAKGLAAKLINDRKADPAWTAVTNGADPGKLVQSHVVNGSRDGIAAMRANLAGDELAQQTITAAALDHLQSKAGISIDGKGTFAQKSYNKQLDAWDAKNAVMLGDAAGKTKTLGNVASYVTSLPAGHAVSTSGTVPAMLQVLAAKTAEHGTNVLFKGLPVGTIAAKGIDALKTRNATTATLKPAAGTTKLSMFP